MLVKECEYILKLYQERSFSRAAEKLYMTQPALSIAVKRFEERIGATLFKRNAYHRTYTDCRKNLFHFLARGQDTSVQGF